MENIRNTERKPMNKKEGSGSEKRGLGRGGCRKGKLKKSKDDGGSLANMRGGVKLIRQFFCDYGVRSGPTPVQHRLMSLSDPDRSGL